MTDLEYQDWLDSPSAIRGILVDAIARVSGVETNFYFSNIGYVTPTADIVYNPIVIGGINVSENLSIDGSGSISFGDIELDNSSGELDGYIDYIWTNRAITIYLGDPRWAKSDFKIIYSGIVSDIDSRNIRSLNLKFRDKLERLNAPINESKLGNYYKGTLVSTATVVNPERESVKPLVFGEVHNISPMLIDGTELEYLVHDTISNNGTIGNVYSDSTTVEQIIEVRDNGVKISAWTQTAGSGRFKVTALPAGELTCSVQGTKHSIDASGSLITTPYTNNIARLIELIVTQYGKASTKFTSTDLDLTNLNNFAAANTQSVGIYVDGRENVLSVCQKLADSIGSQIVMSREGKLRLLKIDPQASPTTYTTITVSDIIQNSFQLVQKLEVKAAIKLGYAYNYTQQPNLQTGIPEEHKEMFKSEWFEITKVDSTVKTDYKLEGEPELISTNLIVESEADAEATRRLNIYKVPRYIYRFVCTSKMMLLNLGDYVRVYHSRFGFTSGKYGQIVGLSQDWNNARITVEILV